MERYRSGKAVRYAPTYCLSASRLLTVWGSGSCWTKPGVYTSSITVRLCLFQPSSIQRRTMDLFCSVDIFVLLFEFDLGPTIRRGQDQNIGRTPDFSLLKRTP